VAREVTDREGDGGTRPRGVDQKCHRCALQNIPAPRSTKRAAYCVPWRARLSPLGKIRRRIRKCIPRHHKRASR
jgi:hypothetical protein